MNIETILTNTAAIATIIGVVLTAIGTILTFKHYRKTKHSQQIVENIRAEIARKTIMFDYFKIHNTSKNIESKLSDWITKSYTTHGQSNDDLLKSVQELLSLLNEIIVKMDDSPDEKTIIEDNYQKINDLYYELINDTKNDNDLISEPLKNIQNCVRSVIQVFARLLNRHLSNV